MSKLLFKELKLASSPNLFIYTTLGVLVIVPAYPYSMIFIFSCLGIYLNFLYIRETNDIFYTALLPIKKRDTVKGKLGLAVFSQMMTILISIPFALIRAVWIHRENPVGIQANVAFYGFGFIIFAIFNQIFFPVFFKTAYKVGKAFLLALVSVIIMAIFVEGCIYIPGLKWLDGVETADLVKQLPVLGIGILIYGISLIYAYKRAARNFEKVDL